MTGRASIKSNISFEEWLKYAEQDTELFKSDKEDEYKGIAYSYIEEKGTPWFKYNDGYIRSKNSDLFVIKKMPAMVQKQFAEQVKRLVETDGAVIGLAVAGSWLTQELDAFSDLDLILVTRDNISSDKTKMLAYAQRFGTLLNAFTGEHVGEPRLLICLYDAPLLHVDIKFLTPAEFETRIEDPVLLHDTGGVLKKIMDTTKAAFPYPDFQGIEDRFWIWVHYATLKIGRGEYMEALDCLGFLRAVVLGPLLHMKNNNLPRGVRKAERLPQEDFEALKATIAAHNRNDIITALAAAIALYQKLRAQLFQNPIQWRHTSEQAVLDYFSQIAVAPTP